MDLILLFGIASGLLVVLLTTWLVAKKSKPANENNGE